MIVDSSVSQSINQINQSFFHVFQYLRLVTRFGCWLVGSGEEGRGEGRRGEKRKREKRRGEERRGGEKKIKMNK